MGDTTSRSPTSRHDANYGNFQTELYAAIRREALARTLDKTVGSHRTNRTNS
jgi:hypothetical protein